MDAFITAKRVTYFFVVAYGWYPRVLKNPVQFEAICLMSFVSLSVSIDIHKPKL